MKYISKIFLLAAFSSFMLVSCQDEVLVKTEDTTKADALLAEIAAAQNQLMAFSEEKNELTIKNAALQQTLDDLMADYNELNSNSVSNPTEVHLTVNVISAANAAFSNPNGRQSRIEGLVGATVKANQNGKDIAASSSGNGLYLFKGLVPGQVALRVEAADHTTVVANVYVWIGSGEDVSDADAYNASTQIVLFPIAGDSADKLIGKAYANTSTLDDTLNRKYGTSAQYATAIRDTYFAFPGPFHYGNYTQWNSYTYMNSSTLYDNYEPESIKFADMTAGVKIYARPYLSTHWGINNNSNLNGFITSITYVGLMTSTQVKTDGSFELPIAAASTYNDFDLFSSVEISSDEYVADHERFTKHYGNYSGQLNETGSIVKTFKFFNNGNVSKTIYTGTGVATANVSPNTSLAITRRVITEKWEYSPLIVPDGGNANNWNYLYLYNLPSNGQAMTRNLYFFPKTKIE